MKSILPPEILSIFHTLSEDEKERILKSDKLTANADLEVIENVMLNIREEKKDTTDSFCFLLGRILFHRAKFNEIADLYKKNQTAGMGLWYALLHIYEGKVEEYNSLILELSDKLNNSILLSFIFYVEAIQGLLSQNFSKYIENRENCFNFFLVRYPQEIKYSSDLYKLIQIYMLEMDAFYLRSTYILSMARDKTKECLNLNRALNDRILQAQINNTIGIIELERGNFQIAHQIFLKSEAIAKEIKMDRLLGHVAGSIGEIYLQMGHLDEALFWYNKSYSTVKEWKNDYRSLYVLHASFADIYFAKEEFEKAKIEMEKVLQILENRHFKDLFMQMKYAEILLYLADVSLVESILSQIEKEWKSQLSPTQKTYFLFLLGFLEYKKNNYGNAQDFLQKAMLLSDELGNEILSSKTLVLLSVVFLKKYTLTLDLEELIEADKCLEDIITYLEEKAKYESLSLIYYIRSKIKIIVLDFETALFLLKRGEELARTYTPLLVENYEEKISLVKKAIESDVDTIIDTGLVEFIEDIDSITTILRKESKKLAAPKGEKPIAVLLFHSSGIPIRTYLSEEVRVTDDLLFGGFVSAIRHLMNELFLDQKQKVLSIDHGQYKLLIEFYSNVFSVVVIALRDSYMLRRKMHRLVEHLSVKGLFKDKFKGDLAETLAFELDSLVRNLFGIRSQNPS